MPPFGDEEDDEVQGQDTTNVYNVDKHGEEPKEEKVQPLYQIYEGSKIPVSGQVGPMWKKKFDAAMKAYTATHEAWDVVMSYYNFNHMGSLETSAGTFKRGDGSENIVYSNLNTMLPAVYSKNPDITITSTDKEDDPFCRSMQNLINALIRRRDKINLKPKVKRAAGFAHLTNFGVFKLSYTQKDDSRELAMQEMQKLSTELAKADSQEKVEIIYGKIAALEQMMEIRQPSGPATVCVQPRNLIVDPYAEDMDGTDGDWMIERCFELTAGLNAKYTREEEDEDGGGKEKRLIYKPTHKAVFDNTSVGSREDGMGLVMQALGDSGVSESHTNEERLAYINMYYTECYLVWDKATRRVMLFSRDDWKWPIWIWDDPLNLSRFFPYFIIGYGMSTGGTVTSGEVSYYLDQQDEINDINRQVARIRRSIFNFFFYNSDVVKQDEAEKFIKAIRGVTTGTDADHLVGVKAGEQGKIADMFSAFLPPSAQHEAFFNKEPIMASINRTSNTSDALRGTQFKTNTNESAVNTYQEAARLAVGAKVDVIEDTVSDYANALAELCIQYMTKEEVEGIIGVKLAEGYEQMSVDQFKSIISAEVVAGSMEKPNSVFKKKEAVQIAQGIGQFAQAAPGSAMRIMLRVLEKAFTEVVIHPEDWDAMDQEIKANQTKGVSTGGAGGEGGGGGGDQQAQMMEAAKNLPPEAKAKIMQMHEQGIPNEQILDFIQEQVAQATQGTQNGPAAKPAV